MGGSAKRYGIEAEDLELENRIRGIETELANLSLTNQGVEEYSKARADSIATVTGLRVIGSTPGAVTVAWNPTSIPDLRKYLLVFAEDYSFTENAQSFNATTNSYQFNTASLTGGGGGTVFYCRVRVENSIGTLSAWSDSLSLTTGQASGGDIADGGIGPDQLFDGSVGTYTYDELLETLIDAQGLRGAISGLTINRNSFTRLGIDWGSTCRYELQIEEPGMVKTLSNWTEGNTGGGMRSGRLAADTWYDVYLIKQDSTRNIDVGFDRSNTVGGSDELLIETGYDRSRLLGCFLTDDEKEIVQFIQTKETFIWYSAVTEDPADPGLNPRTEYRLTVPPHRVEAIINVDYAIVIDHADSSDDLIISMGITCLDSDDVAPTSESGLVNISVGDNDNRHKDGAAGQYKILTSDDGKIGIRAGADVDTWQLFEIGTVGWKHLGLHAPIVDDAFI
jgi:hypothetical protein